MRKATVTKRICAVLTALMLTACATTNTNMISDYEPQQGFNDYATFAWADKAATGPELKQPIQGKAKRAMDNAIRTELENKGYYFVDYPLAADFLIDYEMSAVDKLEVVKNHKYYEWLWLDGGEMHSGTNVFKQPPMKHMVEGLIHISVIDGRTNELIWDVDAKKELSETELKLGDGNISATARVLLKNIPARHQ